VLVAKSSTVAKHFALGMMMMAKFDTSCGVFVLWNLHSVFVRFPLQKPQLKRSYWYRPSEISRAIVRRLTRICLVTTESRRALSSCTGTVLNNVWGFQDEIPAPRKEQIPCTSFQTSIKSRLTRHTLELRALGLLRSE